MCLISPGLCVQDGSDPITRTPERRRGFHSRPKSCVRDGRVRYPLAWFATPQRADIRGLRTKSAAVAGMRRLDLTPHRCAPPRLGDCRRTVDAERGRQFHRSSLAHRPGVSTRLDKTTSTLGRCRMVADGGQGIRRASHLDPRTRRRVGDEGIDVLRAKQGQGRFLPVAPDLDPEDTVPADLQLLAIFVQHIAEAQDLDSPDGSDRPMKAKRLRSAGPAARDAARHIE